MQRSTASIQKTAIAAVSAYAGGEVLGSDFLLMLVLHGHPNDFKGITFGYTRIYDAVAAIIGIDYIRDHNILLIFFKDTFLELLEGISQSTTSIMV